MTLVAMLFLIAYSLFYAQAYFFVFSENFETTKHTVALMSFAVCSKKVCLLGFIQINLNICLQQKRCKCDFDNCLC